MRLIACQLLLIISSAASAAGTSEGRYHMLPLTDAEGGLGSDKVIILDSVAGHLWTWTEVPASDGSAGGRFLIYQGQVRPGNKVGEIIEEQHWEPDAPAPSKQP